MSKRWSILSALLATALLFWAMPWLLHQQLAGQGRTDDRLKPAPARTMVVWVTSWLEEDRKLISSLCTAFEKQCPGLRIYLRRVDAAELTAPEAVLPDVVLHTTGDILAPEDALLPLSAPSGTEEDRLASGMWNGRLYGIPLWYSPLVFSVPREWFQQDEAPQAAAQVTAGQAYFSFATPEPDSAASPVAPETLPWRRVLDGERFRAECGMGFLQLLLQCPASLRQALIRLEPVLGKPEAGEAAVCSMETHLERGTEVMALPLQPSAGQRARYVSLCRDSEDARALVAFLLMQGPQAAAVHLASSVGNPSSGGVAFLPNAFLMDMAAMDQLCIQEFIRGSDPVAALLKLR